MAYRRTQRQTAAARRNVRRAQVSRIGRREKRLPSKYRILKRR